MRIIDLFSGAGGLTFGFRYRIRNNTFVHNNKNTIIFANELDYNAAKAFKKNFPDILMLNEDIKSLSKELVEDIIGNQSIDVIIGGPPCQSFSTVGRRLYDEKAILYEEYVRLLKIVRPKIFLFENVKGILSMRETFYRRDKQGNIIYEQKKNPKNGRVQQKALVDHYGDLVIDVLEKRFKNIEPNFGYKVYKKVLNAVDYGVPETRERVFIIGVRDDIRLSWSFPKPINKAPINLESAIGDLPRIAEGEQKSVYEMPPQNDYQRLMRSNCDRITFHYCGCYGDKIRKVIENVKQGEGKNDFNKLIDIGLIDEKYRLTSGYANTYGRLIANKPCTTITNNLMTPSGLRCIHYDQNRALTPREGARIQSFPDWFQFDGNQAQVSSQIGNAVPPLLAIKLAENIEKMLRE